MYKSLNILVVDEVLWRKGNIACLAMGQTEQMNGCLGEKLAGVEESTLIFSRVNGLDYYAIDVQHSFYKM